MSERDAIVTRTAAIAGYSEAERAAATDKTRPLERIESLAAHPLDDAALSFARERERAQDRREHLAAVRRLRRALSLGSVLWAASTALDLYVTSAADEGVLELFLTLQGVGMLVVLIVIWHLDPGRETRPMTLRACDLIAFSTIAAITSIESLFVGGIDSPYSAGVIVVMLARGTAMFSPWPSGALLFGAPALMYPAVVFIGARFDAGIAAQLNDPAALRGFLSMLFFLVTSWLMLTLGGHYAWRVRREAAEVRSIGRYRLERRLGSGGMGHVWEVFDRTLRLRVALKTIRGQYAGSAAIARFEREVRALAELSHPNTVRILDYGVTDDGLWYYAMELLHGENLRQLVTREGPPETARTLHIARQVLGALGEAHRKGIVHRDIKPENIFLAQLGGEVDVVKLLDFGIAKAARGEDVSLTNTGHVIGTPAYMAPELAMARAADARSDIYSFGVTLYYLLSARLPFTEETAAALLAAHLSREPEPLCNVTAPPVPEALAGVVRGCMAKDPNARFASTDEVLAALRSAEAQ